MLYLEPKPPNGTEILMKDVVTLLNETLRNGPQPQWESLSPVEEIDLEDPRALAAFDAIKFDCEKCEDLEPSMSLNLIDVVTPSPAGAILPEDFDEEPTTPFLRTKSQRIVVVDLTEGEVHIIIESDIISEVPLLH